VYVNEMLVPRIVFAPLLLALVSLASACSSSSSPPAGTTGGAAVSSADCATSCESRATTCGYPAADGDQACAALCGGSVTEEQLTCLQGRSCTELATAVSIEAICPAAGATQGVDSGTTHGVDSGTTTGVDAGTYVCGSDNCMGCCKTPTNCVFGTDPTACGAGGGACTVCSTCTATSGFGGQCM
jgi:hypothetical protein